MIDVAELRREGPKRVRRRLEEMVNADVVGFEGARRLFREAFGLELGATRKRPWYCKTVRVPAVLVTLYVAFMTAGIGIEVVRRFVP